MYVVLILVAALVIPRSSSTLWALVLVLFLFVFFLVRYVSTTYSMNDTYLKAGRIAGGRRIRLDSINRIEFGSMRELGGTGFIGSWGWRGRMWSPFIGSFDAVYTDAAKGLVVSGEGVPIYISPKDLEGFARELSRRVRSFTGRLPVDVGDPLGSQGMS